MYGCTATFLFLRSLFNLDIFSSILLIIAFTTAIEFTIGYGYLKFKKVRLWDYSDQFLNYKGIVCPLFSFYWLIISLLYYYVSHSFFPR